MIKRIALLGLILSTSGLTAAPKSQKIVAWDIHKVLFTEQGKHGYQCKPRNEVFELVKELHAQGVKQVILSNISCKSFCKLRQNHPEYFQYFDMSHSLADAEGMLTRKPHGKYFKKFLKRNRDVKPADIIFFDDKAKNIKSARKLCIDGQIFCNTSQARTILKRKGLLK